MIMPMTARFRTTVVRYLLYRLYSPMVSCTVSYWLYPLTPVDAAGVFPKLTRT